MAETICIWHIYQCPPILDLPFPQDEQFICDSAKAIVIACFAFVLLHLLIRIAQGVVARSSLFKLGSILRPQEAHLMLKMRIYLFIC